MSGSRRSGRRRPAPLSVRLSPDERLALEARAGSLPLSAYIKGILFDDQRRGRTRRVEPDRRQLGQILAMLGGSTLTTSLSRLAAAADIGALPVSPSTESALRSAFADVAGMRGLLMQALGVRAEGGTVSDTLSDTFSGEARNAP